MDESRYVLDGIGVKNMAYLQNDGQLVEGFDELSKIGPAVSIFRTCRCKPTDPVYIQAETIARKISQKGFAVITGGGPGVMEAGNKGALAAGGVSVGLNIILPREREDLILIKPNLLISDTFLYAR